MPPSEIQVRIMAWDFARLRAHLFQPDHDEHAAIALVGAVHSSSRDALLVRELHLVDSSDFPPGRYGYRQIAPRLVAELAGRAGDEGLGYLAFHSHPGALAQVALSSDDLATHERLFPHLRDLAPARPIGGVVLGQESAAGDIWFADGRRERLGALVAVGSRIERLTPRPSPGAPAAARFDRQARLFGDVGQARLRRLRVGVIGVGGGGSMIVEQLAHLGVGALTLIDPDVVEEVNLNRIVGATRRDARRRRSKVDVSARLVRRIDRTIRVEAVPGDVCDLPVASRLRDHDFLFLATDTISSRLVLNAIVHQYLIPALQIGVKVDLSRRETIDEVYVAVRPVLPEAGCLQCAGLIDPMRLQEERRSPEERITQNYLEAREVIDPAVMSLNGIAASHAVNVMLFGVTGLADDDAAGHRLYFPREDSWSSVLPRRLSGCRFCGHAVRSSLALGDPEGRLPCRRPRVAEGRAGRPWWPRVGGGRRGR